MKNIVVLLLILPTLCFGQSVKDMILDGTAFDGNWKLSQPNIIGESAAPNYIDRTQAHQPVVMIQIIHFASKEAAKKKMDALLANEESKQYFKKIAGDREEYEKTADGQRKRFILIGRYWLTVEQVGDKDDREQFIQKYAKHITAKTEG